MRCHRLRSLGRRAETRTIHGAPLQLGQVGQVGPRQLWRACASLLNNASVPPLPALPDIRLIVARDRTEGARASGGFFDVRRLDLVARYPDGSESEPFAYDMGARKALDAVVLAAHFAVDGLRHVFLRSAVRPPCAFRAVEPSHGGSLWELPAGLIEVGEEPVATAVRELQEELGFSVSEADVRPLGEWTFPSPGILGERHVFFAIAVDPRSRGTPTEDGSALERAASIVSLPVADAIAYCRRGAIRDAKTELGLRRLAEELP
jgi:ADP-ribose pyrophosphatase